tara:strand:- start:494 stop:1249 length:756 start_codon:yes stop_codon:yes gene_type:complete
MKILITNDDGIFHPGMRALYNAVKPFGEITIIAPDKERSGMSHSITLNESITVNEVPLLGQIGYACSGTPADCVKLGLDKLFDSKPDLVVSGINKGSNTSQNIVYSGTVSAAVEGAFQGIKSIAVSIASLNPKEYVTGTKVTNSIISKLLEINFDVRTIMNINIPAIEFRKIKGIRITRQGKTKYIDRYHQINNQKDCFRLKGDLALTRDLDGNDDHCVVDQYISLTPLKFELTDEVEYQRFKFNENKFSL